MKFNFDEVVDRRGTYSLKWDGGDFIKDMGLTQRYDEHTIPLFTADMDIPVAPPIVDALQKTVEHRIFGYTIIPDEYFQAVQYWFRKRHDWDIQKEEIIYSPGTVHVLNVAVRAFTELGDGIIIQRPVYPPFTQVIAGNGRKVVNNALVPDHEGYYAIDFEDFEAKAKDPATKMFILCHPHNPTGRIFRADELQRLSAICAENDVLIVADEIHGDLIRMNEVFTPIVKAVTNHDHIVTCTAINKTFNTAGLHCTNVVISNPKVRKTFNAEQGLPLPSPFTVSALIAAYTECEEWLEELKQYIDGNLTLVKSFLEENMPQVKVRIPEGTYVMWMDFRGYGLTPEEVHDRIYNRANVLLEDGHWFGPEGKGYQRICVPSPRSMIKEGLERIERAFSDL